MSEPLRYPRPAQLGRLGPRHNVVESSAGTGKTFLLEHLFVDLILSRGVPIDRILVVTYTEKATAELVLRVRALLAEIVDLSPEHAKAKQASSDPEAWLIDEAAKQRLRQALLSFDRASISTIHGFCQRVLHEHSFVQGRLWDEGLVATEAAIRDAFRETLRAEAGASGVVARVLRAWQGSDRTIADLEALLCECASKQGAELRPPYDEERLVRAMARLSLPALDESTLALRLRRGGLRGQRASSCVERLLWLSAALARHAGDGLGFLADRPPGPDKAVADTLAFLEERLPRTGDDAQLAQLAGAVGDLRAAAAPFEAAAMHCLLGRVRARAATDKRRSGSFDFDDMLLLVSRALAPDSPVHQPLLRALRARYSFGLIDEFQDTDETQWSIFRRIFVDSPDGHALTVIGDPKQAIYGFRGANVFVYLEARRALLAANAGRLTLDQNFRSSEGLVDVQNLLFGDSAGFFRPDSGIRYDTPVRCGTPARRLEAEPPEDAAPVVMLKLRARDTESRTGDLLAGLRATIVDELHRLLAPAPRLRLHGRPDGRTTIRPRDVFVLTFTNNESRAVGEALGRAGIAFAFYKRGKLFESPEAEDILAVLRAVASPDERSLVARAFLTRFFDLDLRQAALCLEAGGRSDPGLRLQGWSRLAKRGDIPALFASLLDDSGILRREIFANAGERALTNTMHVLELLQSAWARNHATLPELVELLGAYVRGTQVPPGEEGDLQRLETEKDAVQILTVHMAKGLEADVVFLYGGTGERWTQNSHLFREDGVRVLHVGRLDDRAKRAAEDDKDDERSRLLYVALTRARYRLYLPHYPDTVDVSGPYRQANHHLSRLFGTQLDHAHAAFAVREIPCPVSPPAQEGQVSTALVGPLPDALLALPRPPAEVDTIKASRGGFLVTSYSAVKRALGENPGKPPIDSLAEDIASWRERKGPDELPGGAEAGIFLHEVLATVPLPELARQPTWAAWLSSPGVEPLVERLARRHGRPTSEVAAAARLVHLAYTNRLRLGPTTIEGLASAAHSLREVEFLFPIPEVSHPLLARGSLAVGDGPAWPIERGVVRGFIDLLFEHAGKIYVCDWKSDTLPSYDPPALAEHCRQSYEVQARIYTMASLRFAGITGAADYERRFGGMVFCFLRGLSSDDDSGGLYFARPAWDTVVAWETAMLAPAFWGVPS